MSDTTYVQEVTRVRGLRVALTMDAAEVRALADVAAAAIDGAIFNLGLTEETSAVLRNSQKVYDWAVKAADTLDLTSDKE